MEWDGGRTFAGEVALHEVIFRASFRELRGQHGELGERLINDPDFGGEGVVVDVFCGEAADEACGGPAVSGGAMSCRPAAAVVATYLDLRSGARSGGNLQLPWLNSGTRRFLVSRSVDREVDEADVWAAAGGERSPYVRVGGSGSIPKY